MGVTGPDLVQPTGPGRQDPATKNIPDHWAQRGEM